MSEVQSVSPAPAVPSGAGEDDSSRVGHGHHRPYRPALDGLRGIAVAGVLLFHTGHLAGGFLGVDLFFALSGYLITDGLLREISTTGRLSIPAFFARRARRLLPALVAVLVGVTLVVQLTQPAALVRTTLSDGPWVQANLANWHLLAESAGYWDRFGSERVFEHLWSIAVEEQFYLVWPLLVLLVASTSRQILRVQMRVMVATIVLSAVSLLLMVVLLDPSDPSRVYTGTDTRAFSLLLGALVATGPARTALDRLPRLVTGFATVLTIVVLSLMWGLTDGTTSSWLFRGGLFLHSLMAALLIVACSTEQVTWPARVLSLKPLRRLGKISYGLYLWHWPIIVLLSPEWTGLPDGPWTVGVIAASLTAAALSKWLIEDPIRFRAGWARGKRGALALGVCTVALALFWLLLPTPAPPVVDLSDL